MADWDAKKDFMKALFSSLRFDEIKRAEGILNKAKKRRIRSYNSSKENKVQPESGHCSKSTEMCVKGSGPSVGITLKEVVAIDVEMLVLLNATGFEKNAACFVSIYGQNRVIFESKIKHMPETIECMVPQKTRFHYKDFNDAESLENVSERVDELLKNKKVVGLSLSNDLAKLGLEFGDYDSFDLHKHFFWEKEVNFRIITEKIGLRTLAHFYFNVDIHENMHDCNIDAEYTYKLYYKYLENVNNNITGPFNHIEKYPKIKETFDHSLCRKYCPPYHNNKLKVK